MRSYRLLEYNDVIVNATVSELSNKEKADMKQLGLNQGIDEMVYGFFFELFYIKTANGHILFDRQLHIIDQKGDFTFTKGRGTLNCPVQGISPYVSTIIQVDGVKISLRKYANPQVLNGIDVSVENIENAKGLLNSFTNPKNYTVKKITSVKPVEVLQNTVYNKKVKDAWVTTK